MEKDLNQINLKMEIAESHNIPEKEKIVWLIWGLSLSIYYGLKLIADAIKESK